MPWKRVVKKICITFIWGVILRIIYDIFNPALFGEIETIKIHNLKQLTLLVLKNNAKYFFKSIAL